MSNKIVPSSGSHICIMDDETYVHSDPNQVPGRKFYSELPNYKLEEAKKVKKVEKYAEKFLVCPEYCCEYSDCWGFVDGIFFCIKCYPNKVRFTYPA